MSYVTMTVLRIEQAPRRISWYSEHVGGHVPFEGVDHLDGYSSREPAGYRNFVALADARPVRVRITEQAARDWPFNSTHHSAAKRHLPDLDTPDAVGTADVPSSPMHRLQCAAPTGQSRRASLAEAIANVVVGYLVSVVITAIVMPAFGHDVTLAQNLGITAIFTAASLLRAYCMRRWFNKLEAA